MSRARLASPHGLRCEYRIGPVGIDLPRPRLQWRLPVASGGEGFEAEVQLALSEARLLAGSRWESGCRPCVDPWLDYDGPPLVSATRYFWRVRLRSSNGADGDWSTVSRFTTGVLDPKEWRASWITSERWESYLQVKTVMTPEIEEVCARQFVREFELPGAIVSALFFVCGLGSFELYLNGERVGDHRLDPAQSAYDRRSYYVAFDVTDSIARSNCIGIVLGNGRYLGAYGFGRPKLIVQGEIELADGTHHTILSDGDWLTASAATRENGIYFGEELDGRRVDPAWCLPGSDRSSWERAAVVDGHPLSAQLIDPIRVTQILEPVALRRLGPHDYLYDFGQNISGVARLTAHGPRGARIELRYAELLGDDGRPNRTTLRAARSTDGYVLSGEGEETWEPRFTYHGFRYIEMIGYPGVPDLTTLRALVLHTDVRPSGSLSLGNDLLARVHRNITWGQRANLMSIPTDCPQRDERQGWLGDAQLAAEEAILNFDMARFYIKYLDDIADSQLDDGSLSDVVPPYWSLYPADPAWGTAFITIAWLVYRYYGDDRPIRKHFDAMQRYVDFLSGRAEGHILRTLGKYGDWCPPGSILPKRTPVELTSTWYYYHDTSLLARLAEAIGRHESAVQLRARADAIRDAFNREYLRDYGYATVRMSPDDRTPGQTSNLLPLALDMVPADHHELVVEKLLESVEVHYDRHLDTGILGTRYLFDVLTELGRADLAYAIATQKSYPGFGYMLAEGATTLWERWECLTGAGMNSHNHIMLGSVDAWMYRSLAGVECIEPGWRKVRIKPHCVNNLQWAGARIETVRGMVSASWEMEGDDVLLIVEIPPSAAGEVYVPAGSVGRLEKEVILLESERMVFQGKAVNGTSYSGALGIARYENGFVRLDVPSGFYQFRSATKVE